MLTESAGIDAASLSPAQQGIWYAAQLDEAGTAYHTARYLELTGEIDTGALVEAVAQTVTEVEGFHMRFRDDGDQVVQVPQSPDCTVPTVDLTEHADPAAAADAWMRADLQHPLDLRAGLVFRTALLRTGPETLLWYLCCQHIAIDGHGFTLVQQRVAATYTALLRNEHPAPSPFGELAAVHREEAEYRSSEAFAADRAFWLTRFTERPAPTTLAGRTAPAAAAPLRRSVLLPSSTAARIPELASTAHATWPEVLVAALAAFLHRETGADTVTVGLPSMARTRATLRVPTTTANVLPVRISPRSASPVSELVGETAREMREVRKHQRYRAEELRRDLGIVGTGSSLSGPLVNIKPPAPKLPFGDVDAVMHYLAAGPVDDMTLTAYREHDDAIRLDFDVNPTLYHETTLHSLSERFVEFLREMVAPHDPTVGALSVRQRSSDQDDPASRYEPKTLSERFTAQPYVSRAMSLFGATANA